MSNRFVSGNRSPALLTDLYELTMAQGYWGEGMADREAAFHLVFRKNPFDGGYAVACGLAQVVEYLTALRFEDDDLSYLAGLKGNDGNPLFREAFLDELSRFRPRCTVHAVPEGTVVFPHEPLVRVTGPVLDSQIIESALLNAVGFQTLIATKAARVCQAARGQPVMEFGLRRAQGPGGALAASRAAYVGGCAGTSNVLAGKEFGIPVKGTHAHSWVLAFDDERAAFEAYARAVPNNCIFLVDTYDSLQGTRNAIEAAGELDRLGGKLAGIRLDSGDLAYLSTEARRLLNEASYEQSLIVGSGDLDEHVIETLHNQNAAIGAWGVGTNLVTGGDDPALSVVYKLTALRAEDGRWKPRLKLSEQIDKINIPGVLQVRRFREDDRFVADAIFDEQIGVETPCQIMDPVDPTRHKTVEATWSSEDLLEPVYVAGQPVGELPGIEASRDRCRAQLARLHPGIKRFMNPHEYPAGIERQLHELRDALIVRMRQQLNQETGA